MSEGYDIQMKTLNLVFQRNLGDPKINTILLVKGDLNGIFS